jgi:hypothetical protein
MKMKDVEVCKGKEVGCEDFSEAEKGPCFPDMSHIPSPSLLSATQPQVPQNPGSR